MVSHSRQFVKMTYLVVVQVVPDTAVVQVVPDTVVEQVVPDTVVEQVALDTVVEQVALDTAVVQVVPVVLDFDVVRQVVHNHFVEVVV